VADGRLEAILDRTRAIAPRPTWLVLVRGGATTTLLPPGSRQRTMPIVLAALLLLATIALALFIAGQRHPPLHLGLMAFTERGDVYLAQPDGSDAVLVAHDDSTHLSIDAWSPDGRWLVVDGEYATFLLDPATRKLQRLTDGGFMGWASDSRSILGDGPRWIGLDGHVGPHLTSTRLSLAVMSPDGRSIAGIANGEFVIVDVASGAVTEVAQAGGYGFGYSAGGGADAPAWSPDSSWVAFVALAPGVVQEVKGTGGPSMIAVVDRDGTDLRSLETTIGDTGRPSWSPDGTWIAYANGATLHVVRPDGAGDRQLVDHLVHGRFDADPYLRSGYVWEPGGIAIRIFRTGSGSPIEPWRVDVATGEAARLTVAEHAPDRIAWQTIPVDEPVPSLPTALVRGPSPTDARIPLAPAGDAADVGSAWRALAFDVWSEDGMACQGATFDFGTSTLQTPVARCWTDRSLGWSPDGRHHAGIAGDETVEITDGIGTIIATVHGEWSRVTRAGWSPSGGWIWVDGCSDQMVPEPTPVASGPSAAPGFGFTPGDPTCLAVSFIIRAVGSPVRAIPGHPLWSADDGRMVVGASDGTIQVGPGDGSAFQAIGSFPMPAAWSPDATRLAFLQDGDAWIVNADGSAARDVTRFALPVALAVSWSPTADLLAVTQNATTWLVPRDGG